MEKLKPCPFCGEIPRLPSGLGTQYEIECDCGKAMSSVQISDLMTVEERQSDEFVDHRYQEIFVDRAQDKAINNWNDRKDVNRKDILLKATLELLETCDEGKYIKNVLYETSFYDGTNCDGFCLMQDIKDELGLDDE